MFISLIVLISLVLIYVLIKFLYFIINRISSRRKRKNTVAFFHLYCSSGGGGERVLWHTIETLLKKYPNYTIFIYSHKNVKEDALQILLKVKELFKIDLISDERFIDKLEFIPLSWSPLIEANRYPYLTLLFQNLGSILLACQAIYMLLPEVYVETIGFTFTLPIFKLHRCTVITYVHYPTISNDMLDNVRTSTHASFNNREIFTRSPVLRKAKLAYYRILACLYGFAGRRADLVMVNSSWTKRHIDSLWQSNNHVVYPPCDVESFKSNYDPRNKSKTHRLNIISIAQFRPEKRHELQIEAFDNFISKYRQTGDKAEALSSKLILYGGCRNQEDNMRIRELHDLLKRLDGIENQAEIVANATFEQLLEGLQFADVAIHTMENEHFGIVLVECMAAGLITVAHSSGGPKTDIIDDNMNGFLANDYKDFAEKLTKISRMSFEEREEIRKNAMLKADQFSVKKFEEKFIRLVDPYLSK